MSMRKPPFDHFPVLSDDKVVLRQIDDTDLADLVDITFYDAVQANTWQQAKEMNADKVFLSVTSHTHPKLGKQYTAKAVAWKCDK